MLPLDSKRRRSLREAALRIANSVRKEMGLPPVTHLYKGTKGHPRYCVISQTIRDDDAKDWNIYTGGCDITVSRDEQYFQRSHSDLSREFIKYFDEGDFPRLEKK
jgi:hypothetical protein